MSGGTIFTSAKCPGGAFCGGTVFTMTPVYSSCDIDLKGAHEARVDIFALRGIFAVRGMTVSLKKTRYGSCCLVV